MVIEIESGSNKTLYQSESHSRSTKKTIPETSSETARQITHSFAEPLPDYFKETHAWHIGILKSPSCPNVDVIRLIKSSPFNSELRRYIRSHMKNQGASSVGVFFLIGLHNPSDQANAHIT